MIDKEIGISYASDQKQLQTVQCYTLFFPGGRVYAGDTDGRLVALALITSGQGRFSYLLEGNGETECGFVCAASLLEGIAARLTAEYLDGHFRCMPDLAKADVFDLTAGPHLNIKLQGR